MVRARAQVAGPSREIAVGRSRSEAAGGVADWWCRHEEGAVGQRGEGPCWDAMQGSGVGGDGAAVWRVDALRVHVGGGDEHGAWGWVVMREGRWM